MVVGGWWLVVGKWKRNHFLLIISFCSLTTAGCLFIDKRSAQAPLQDNGGRTPPLSATELLDELTQSFTLRNPNLYLQSFDNSGLYQYSPDAEAIARYGAALDSFNYPREVRFIQALFSRQNLPVDSSSTSVFTLVSEQPQSSGSTVEMTYSIRLGTTVNVPRSVSGRAIITLVRGTDGGYVIQSWHDNPSGSDPTIANWKAVIQ